MNRKVMTMGKGWRKIVVGEKEWKYQIGQGSVVARCDGKSVNIDFGELTGLSWDTIERSYHERQFHITPKLISELLSNI